MKQRHLILSLLKSFGAKCETLARCVPELSETSMSPSFSAFSCVSQTDRLTAIPQRVGVLSAFYPGAFAPTLPMASRDPQSRLCLKVKFKCSLFGKVRSVLSLSLVSSKLMLKQVLCLFTSVSQLGTQFIHSLLGNHFCVSLYIVPISQNT